MQTSDNNRAIIFCFRRCFFIVSILSVKSKNASQIETHFSELIKIVLRELEDINSEKEEVIKYALPFV